MRSSVITDLETHIEKSISISLEIPDAGNIDSRDVYALLNRKKELKNIYEILFGNSTFEEFAKSHQYWSQTDGDFHLSIKPNHTKINFFHKTQWLFVTQLETEEEIYELCFPIHQDQYDLYLIGIFSLGSTNSILDWSESCLIIKNKKTQKERKIIMRFSEKRENLTWYSDRVYLVILEDVALQHLSTLNINRLSNQVESYPVEMIREALDVLRIWSLLKVEWASQNRYEKGREQRISFHSGWEKFNNFYIWAIENGYYYGASLTRCGNERGFYPQNVIWMENKAKIAERYHLFEGRYFSHSFISKIAYEVKGETKSLAEWEALSGIPCEILFVRRHLKWSDDQLFLPLGHKVNEYTNKLITINDETKTVKEWAELTGISVKTIVSRIRYGWQGNDLISPPRSRENQKKKDSDHVRS